MYQQTYGLNQAEHDEHAGELPEKPGNVSLNGQCFEIDNAQKKLAIENMKRERQAAKQLTYQLRHG